MASLMPSVSHALVLATCSFMLALGASSRSLRIRTASRFADSVNSGTVAAANTTGTRISFTAFVDTTCSDCQDWVLQQFKPLWMDPEYRAYLTATYKFEVNAMSVTRHEQGPYLNAALLCAQQELGIEAFFEPFFCWESNMEAWIPIPGTNSYEQATIDVPSLLGKCFPEESVAGIQACLDDPNQAHSLLNAVQQDIPEDLDEVPFIVIGDARNEHEAVFSLSSFLCTAAAGTNLPSSCAGATATATLLEHSDLFGCGFAIKG